MNGRICLNIIECRLWQSSCIRVIYFRNAQQRVHRCIMHVARSVSCEDHLHSSADSIYSVGTDTCSYSRYSGMVLYFLVMLISLLPTPSYHRQTHGSPFSLFPVGLEVTLFSHAPVVTLDTTILFPGQKQNGISHNRRGTFRTLFLLDTHFGEKARREEQEATPMMCLRIFLFSGYELQR
ncbi:hypothetical protein BXZ70DRAFT_507002 [Cristinia sonorae]|uniref:Uncharacterized protein n=1 Tax=Cristinia sonorae TaxID=1940300 RepID=A0A8K0UX47_9AGAR|nr:hypothetical protein BXZ70DRAFT_507002 [Cristinia sonorae]